MLFSKMNFRQMFVSRPVRRRGGYAVAAEVQTLQSKVLLSAVPIESEETGDESTDDYMSEYADDFTYASSDEYIDETTEETPAEGEGDSIVSGGDGEDTVSGGDGEGTVSGGDGEGDSPDSWINYVQTINSGGSVSVTGMISSLSGDFSNLTLSFEGAFAGVTATIASDGSFSTGVLAGSTGNVGFVNLLQTENGVTTQIGQHSMYV